MATGVQRGTVYDHFEENEQLCGLIEALPETSHEQIAREANEEKVTCNIPAVYVPLTHPRVLHLMQTSLINTRSNLIYWTRTWVSAAV